jgi:hypothetical protein
VRLARLLYQRGYARAEIERLYKFIDWLLQLPPELEESVWRQVQVIEEEQRMAYITYAERRGLEQGRTVGRAEGLRKGIALAAKIKFGAASEPLLPEIGEIADPDVLEAIVARLETATTIEEIRAIYESGA